MSDHGLGSLGGLCATREGITEWFRAAPVDATHMLVVCDEFSWDDYPVYVISPEDPRERVASYDGESKPPMQKVLEVYHLGYSLPKQLALHRAFVYELPLDGHDDAVLERCGDVALEELGQWLLGSPALAAVANAELQRRKRQEQIEAQKLEAERRDAERKAARGTG